MFQSVPGVVCVL